MLSHGFLSTGAPTRSARAIGYLAGHLGALGVAVFFAISGYLITTLLLEDQNLRGFYIRRAFRILPAAYLYLIVVSIAEPLRHGELASAAFFYSNYWPDRSWYTAHFWSLSAEEHFYLLWPVLAGVPRREASAHSRRPAHRRDGTVASVEPSSHSTALSSFAENRHAPGCVPICRHTGDPPAWPMPRSPVARPDLSLVPDSQRFDSARRLDLGAG